MYKKLFAILLAFLLLAGCAPSKPAETTTAPTVAMETAAQTDETTEPSITAPTEAGIDDNLTAPVAGEQDRPEETEVPPTTQPEETEPPATEPEETVPPTTQPPETEIPETEPEETKAPETEAPETDSPAQCSYVINTSTGKFHETGCSDVKRIKDKNRWDYTGTREDVIAMGYSPCGHCKP